MGGGYFSSARITQGLRSQKHCLLPKLNSHNQPQQKKHSRHKKAVIWHKIAGVCRTFSDKNRYNAAPANACILTNFVQQMPDFIRHLPDFDALQQKRD